MLVENMYLTVIETLPMNEVNVEARMASGLPRLLFWIPAGIPEILDVHYFFKTFTRNVAHFMKNNKTASVATHYMQKLVHLLIRALAK